MNKAMFLIGMAGGSTLTYMVLNKDMRNSAKKAIDNMFNEADKILK